MMFSKIRIEGYRNLLTGDLPLSPLTVLIGPNNSGKSNFLRALHFSADLAGGGPRPAALSDAVVSHKEQGLRGWDWPKPRPVVFSWHSDADYGQGETKGKIRHRLAFHLPVDRPFPAGFRVDAERFTFGTGPVAPVDAHWKPSDQIIELAGEQGPTVLPADALRPQDSMLLQAQAMLEQNRLRTEVWSQIGPLAKTWLADMKAQCAIRCALVDPSRISAPIAAVAEERFISVDGSNLANVLRHIDQNHVDGLRSITTALRDLVPELERIIVVEGGGNQRWIRLQLAVNKLGRGRRHVELWDMSDGTVQALLMATLLHSPDQPRLITVDEPELNLHPAWLRRLGTWMSEARRDTQLVMSTHSPELLDALTDGFVAGRASVLVFGGGRSSSITTLKLADVRERFDAGWQLGDLYRVGDQSVGGWPW